MSNEQKKGHQKNFAYTFKTEVMTSKNGSIWALFGKSWLWGVTFAVFTSAVLIFAVESTVVYVICMHVYYNNISCKIITDVGS